MWWQTRLLFCCVLLLYGVPSAMAQVRDDAFYFKVDTVRKANEAIAKMKRRYGKTFIVETYKGIPAEWKAKYDPQKKDAFFLKLVSARAKARKLDGLYMLMCKRPTWLQVSADPATERKSFPKAVNDRLFKLMKDRFGKGEYDEGLLDLVALVEKAFAGELGDVRERKRARPSSEPQVSGLGKEPLGRAHRIGVSLVPPGR